ncbi:nuclear transport factor 2 family protein [Hamadaea tsunoensis]|uniref:nuclear transport factor 2 family protein n=1 Tax=Hamadaea tsunoensis TaxID=53368 RepID=UPI000557EE70|nr:nuclear transport factor 2 family protein [Hamadaea tsunoensis]
MTTRSLDTDNKAIVQQALTDLVATGDVDALGRRLSEDFVHHRPDAYDLGKAEWLDAVRAAFVPLADQRVDVKLLLADGEHVIMYSHRALPDGGPEVAVVDIWRVHEGLVAEGWEIIEPLAEAARHLSWWNPAA